MKSKVIFQFSPIKDSKIDMSPHELLIISDSILNVDNLTDNIYLWVIMNFSNFLAVSINLVISYIIQNRL